MGFKDFPIRRKLMLVIMATSSVALILEMAVIHKDPVCFQEIDAITR